MYSGCVAISTGLCLGANSFGVKLVTARLLELKQQLPEHLIYDTDANNEIYENFVVKEAPGCLRSSNDSSKGKNLIFTSREEFDQAVQQKSTAEMTSVRKNFEDELSQFKNDYGTKLEMLQARLNTIENQNVHEKKVESRRRKRKTT